MTEFPVFGIIMDILVWNTDKYFIVYQLLTTNHFSHHYHAYNVVFPLSPDYVTKEYHFLLCNSLLGLIKKDSNYYVTLKYNVH